MSRVSISDEDVKGGEELTVIDYEECRMILEVGAYTRGVDDDINVQRLEEIGRPNAAELQYPRGVHSTSCKNDVLRCYEFGLPAITADDFDARDAASVKLDRPAIVTDEEVEIRSIAGRGIICRLSRRANGLLAIRVLREPREPDILSICAVFQDRRTKVLSPSLCLQFYLIRQHIDSRRPLILENLPAAGHCQEG